MSLYCFLLPLFTCKPLSHFSSSYPFGEWRASPTKLRKGKEGHIGILLPRQVLVTGREQQAHSRSQRERPKNTSQSLALGMGQPQSAKGGVSVLSLERAHRGRDVRQNYSCCLPCPVPFPELKCQKYKLSLPAPAPALSVWPGCGGREDRVNPCLRVWLYSHL